MTWDEMRIDAPYAKDRMSFTRALVLALGDEFDKIVTEEQKFEAGYTSDKVPVNVTLWLTATQEQLDAVQQLRENGLPKASAAPASGGEPDPARALRREGITLRPRIAHGHGVTAWEAQFDGRLPSGERVIATVDGTTSGRAVENLEAVLNKEGWWVRG